MIHDCKLFVSAKKALFGYYAYDMLMPLVINTIFTKYICS